MCFNVCGVSRLGLWLAQYWKLHTLIKLNQLFLDTVQNIINKVAENGWERFFLLHFEHENCWVFFWEFLDKFVIVVLIFFKALY